ncbi:MAG: T9SS type A sorting domain-containing protein [Bacteroidetes bacterium]|nr:T9SS type A sorting domain-containing protein [Bacteroidota bacterium]
MKIILLSLACLSSAIMNSQTFEYLDINQVKARVNSGGDLHWDPATGNSAYECPKGSSKTWGGPASLWIGGLDAGNQLHLAAQTYHQSGTDFWPGPLSTNNATTNSVTVNQYNRVWKLNKSDIDDFITNYANGNVQNGSYTPVADLLSWPGNGDMSQNQDVLLAPFMDANADDVYSPMDGDYPIIKGDQAIFTIFNDNYLPHQNTGAPAIGLEIRLMAYAYAPTNTLVTGNPSLNYTTFYNYAIINRSPNTLYNAQISLFNDSDIGNYMDDYVGCNVTNAYAYTYNNITSTVTNQPAIGIKQTMGPVNTTNAIDDNHDGMIDEPGEQMGMTNFMYFSNSFPGVPLQISDPNSATDYFQYMNSIWKDGTPLTCGGNGYGGNITSNYAYPANSFTTGPCGVAPWSEGDAGSDKKFVMSSGQTVLLPGSFTEVEYAYITAFDSITNDPLSALSSAMNALRTMQNSSVTGIKEQPLDNSFTLSPNPTNGILNISSSLKTTGFKIEVIDALGKVLISEDHKDISQTSIHVENLSSGIYFVKLVSGENTTTKKFIKE